MECVVRPYVREEEFLRAAAQWVVREAAAAVRARGRFLWVLSGGETPRDVYAALARPPLIHAVDWRAVHCFFCDERCVPPDHAWSNYAMAAAAMLHKTPIPMGQIRRLRGEAEPGEAAEDYARLLEQALGPATDPEALFDLALLGLGPDGHTASLFPGSPALGEQQRLVAAVSAPDREPRVPRLTMTFPALNRTRKALFLVREPGKEEALAKALARDPAVPAGCVTPREELAWVILRPDSGPSRIAAEAVPGRAGRAPTSR